MGSIATSYLRRLIVSTGILIEMSVKVGSNEKGRKEKLKRCLFISMWYFYIMKNQSYQEKAATFT